MLRARGTDVVAPEAANESRVGLLMATDSCQIGQVCGRRAGGGILERLEGRVLLQALGQVLGGLRVEVVAAETANEKGVGLSMAIDSCQIGQVCGERAGGHSL